MRPPFLRPIRQLLIGAVALFSTACASGGRAALSPAEIEEKFDLGYHTKHVDTIFARVFGE